jgi:hypothetical protein
VKYCRNEILDLRCSQQSIACKEISTENLTPEAATDS